MMPLYRSDQRIERPEGPARRDRSRRLATNFYAGAARIEHWLDEPKVWRFMNAATMWYFVLAGVFVLVCVIVLLVALVVSVVG